MEIVVNDTNIFIDLCKLHILPEVFNLPLKMHTTDLVIAELTDEDQKTEVLAYQTCGKLHVHSFTSAELMAVVELQLKAGGNVSLTDCSAWHYAENNGYTLLTGDGQLRRKAQASNVKVCGLLFLMDLLVTEHVMEPPYAADKLRELLELNRRMPLKQIEERISAWSKGKCQ